MQIKDLTKGSIGKELFTLALPLMIANLVNIAYNMIDMFFIGKSGDEALTAVGTAGLFLWLAASIVYFSKQGMETFLSQAIGRGNIHESRDIIKTGVGLNIVIATVYSLIILIFAGPLIRMFNLESEVINEIAIIYLRIGSIAVWFMMINQNLMSIFQARGQTKQVLIYNSIGLVFNMVLDPILIITLGLGATGAAIATVAANIIVFAISVVSILKFERQYDAPARFVKSIAVKILRISFPTGSYNVFFTVVAMLVSSYSIRYGDNVIAASRIGSQVESLSWMFASGLGIACSVFTGQNYGAKNKERIDRAYRYLFRFSTVYGLFLLWLFIAKAEPMMRIFTSSDEIVEIGIVYFYCLSFQQVFTLYEGIASGYFNGYGFTKIPSFFSISGNVLRLILVVVLSNIFGLNGIWLAISLSGIYRGLGLIICKVVYDYQGKMNIA
ncbi:MATE family efflux transporter [Mollicutes bacterium LVI A0039]|nr:MATE family efflux transporter [Mollicutes bacterium LVI A0039]